MFLFSLLFLLVYFRIPHSEIHILPDSACPVKCLPREISVALISLGRSPFTRGGENNLCRSALIRVQLIPLSIFLTKLTSYQSSVIIQEAHKNSPNM